MSLLDDLIRNADIAINLINQERDNLEENDINYVVPNGTTKISESAFYGANWLKSILIPTSVTTIREFAFYNTGITSLIIPEGCTQLERYIAQSCKSLTSVELPSTLNGIGYAAFDGCTSLTTLNIKSNLITYLDDSVFYRCSALENVTLANNWQSRINLSVSSLYSADTIVSWFNALADRTGDTAYALTIGSTNLNKLTAEQIAIATDKNWNLA